MDCPKCKLISPDDAQRCDCGFDFVTKEMTPIDTNQAAEQERDDSLRVAVPLILIGIGFHVIPYCLGSISMLQSFGLVLICIGGAKFAESKGRNKFWGLLGFFSILGIVALIFIPRKKSNK